MPKKILPKRDLQKKEPFKNKESTPVYLSKIQNAKVDLSKSKRRIERLELRLKKRISPAMKSIFTEERMYYAMLEAWIEHKELVGSGASFQKTTKASIRYSELKKRFDAWIKEKSLNARIKRKGKDKSLKPLS